jgi:hypothetical protein
MFLAAALSAHLQLIKHDEHVVLPHQSRADQQAPAELLAHLRSQSLTRLRLAGHTQPASADEIY